MPNVSPDSNPSYGALLIKKMGLGSSRHEEVPQTDCEITHLPNELLECILLKLSYAEIAQVRQVCRRFRDVGDGILDREFRCLKTRAKSHLAALAEEENALPEKPAQSETGSTGRAENDSAVPKPPTQMDSHKLLSVICSEIRLLGLYATDPCSSLRCPMTFVIPAPTAKGISSMLPIVY
jgi:hypothetical protein